MLPQKNGSSLEKVLKNFFCIAKIKKNKGKHPKNPKKRLYRNKNSGGVCYIGLKYSFETQIIYGVGWTLDRC